MGIAGEAKHRNRLGLVRQSRPSETLWYKSNSRSSRDSSRNSNGGSRKSNGGSSKKKSEGRDNNKGKKRASKLARKGRQALGGARAAPDSPGNPTLLLGGVPLSLLRTRKVCLSNPTGHSR